MGRRKRNRKRYPRRYCTIEYLKCIKLNDFGKGVVRWHDKDFYVDELLPGEEARIIVYYEDEHFGEARAIDIKNESPDRVLPLGHPKFSIGSYQIPHMSSEAQRIWKQARVQKLFGNNIEPIKFGNTKNYRNKLSLTNGGFMAPGKGRKISINPTREQFDLMDIDLLQYKDSQGVLIIRQLDELIVAKPGTKISTTDSMLGKKFIVGLDSFYQVNGEMAKIAYQDIISNVTKDSIVYDLFSGIGTIGLIVSDIAKKVYCVELNNSCHKDAVENIKINNVKNVEPILGDANLWVQNSKVKPDVIIIDPARAGISEQSASVINKSGAHRIIYLSCNITTQQRDVELFTNYNVKKIQPYDFFPQTYHIENLIILDKK